MAKKPADVLEMVAKHGVGIVDLRYCAENGGWHGASVPAARLDAAALSDGIVAGSGKLVPDLESATLDALAATPTLALICDRVDAAEDDPRLLLKRARARAASLADEIEAGSTLRYSLFDALAYEDAADARGYRLEACAPREASEVRSQVLAALLAAGVDVAFLRANPDAPEQSELEVNALPLVAAADAVTTAKQIVTAVAERSGKSATFMPKPSEALPGNAWTVRIGLLKDGKSPFFEKSGWAGSSQTLLHFVGGLLAHADSLAALCAPSTNSYKRLAAEPLLLAFGERHPASVVAVRADAKTPRIESRLPDATAQPHLALAALICAGLDGVARRSDPISAGFGPLEPAHGKPATSLEKLRKPVGSLGSALDALERDHAYLTEGEVFPESAVRAWLQARRADVAAIDLRPHPAEFARWY